MKKIIPVFLLAITAPVLGQEHAKPIIERNYIEVNGFAERQIAPDLILMKIVVNEKDFRGQTLTHIEKSMFEKFQVIGIDIPAQVVVRDHVDNFRYYWVARLDHLSIKEYQLLVNDVKTVGNVYMELEKIGVTNIAIEKIGHSGIDSIRREVAADAIRFAKDKADAIARSIGQETGKAIYIQEFARNLNMQGPLVANMVRGLAVKGSLGPKTQEPDIEFERIRLEYGISVRFELK